MFSMAMGDPEARRLARQLDVIAGNGSIKTLAEQSGKSKKKARTEKNNKKSLCPQHVCSQLTGQSSYSSTSIGCG
jgi:hypothetical protein